MELSDFIGTLGVALLLVAFLMQRLGRVEATIYSLLNAVGAAAAAAASLLIHYIPFVVLEALWCLVALASLRYDLKRKKAERAPDAVAESSTGRP